MKTLADRLKEEMDRLDMAQDELARKAKMAQSSISKLVSGRSKESRKISKIAAALGVNTDWLSTGMGDKFSNISGANAINWLATEQKNNNLNQEPENDNEILKERIVRVPMIDIQDSINWKQEVMNCESTIIMTSPLDRKDLFAVRVSDDSMKGEGNEFNIDDVLIIDPHMEAKHLHYVIVSVGGIVTFRQLFNDMGEWLLRPLNQQFKIKPLGDGVIIGIVRRKIPKETDYC